MNPINCATIRRPHPIGILICLMFIGVGGLFIVFSLPARSELKCSKGATCLVLRGPTWMPYLQEQHEFPQPELTAAKLTSDSKGRQSIRVGTAQISYPFSISDAVDNERVVSQINSFLANPAQTELDVRTEHNFLFLLPFGIFAIAMGAFFLSAVTTHELLIWDRSAFRIEVVTRTMWRSSQTEVSTFHARALCICVTRDSNSDGDTFSLMLRRGDGTLAKLAYCSHDKKHCQKVAAQIAETFALPIETIFQGNGN